MGMKVGIHASDKDINKRIQYCSKIKVDQFCLACSSIRGYDERGYPDPDALREVKGRLADAGISVPVMTVSKWPSPEVLLGKPEARGELNNLYRTIGCLGEVSVSTALLYSQLDRPKAKAEEAIYWERLLEFFRRLMDVAERSQVKIANHAYYLPQKLVRNSEGLKRILETVPSPHNGVTYCPGLYQSGDDVYRAISLFGEKIFFAHARDLRKKGAEFDEVFLGEGDIDLPRSFVSYRKLGIRA
ncbi:MAG: mannonate dehydratase [Candidatus Bathyarchaeia archaeon]